MVIGIPKEIKDNEKRVSLTPYGASELVKSGNAVIVEKNAGLGSGFTDHQYIRSGATLHDNPDDIFSKSNMIVKVKEPQPEEIKKIKEFCSGKYDDVKQKKCPLCSKKLKLEYPPDW